MNFEGDFREQLDRNRDFDADSNTDGASRCPSFQQVDEMLACHAAYEELRREMEEER